LFDELVRSVLGRNLEIVKQIQKCSISLRRKLRNLITTLERRTENMNHWMIGIPFE
jgi:hypothetical protein